jgi:hypothetical protein
MLSTDVEIGEIWMQDRAVSSTLSRIVLTVFSLLAFATIGISAQQSLSSKSPFPAPVESQSLSPERSDDVDYGRFGSVNVPMDSWMYPALERLANMGLIPSQDVSIRPWSRLECKRQVNEAQTFLANKLPVNVDPSLVGLEAKRIIDALNQELSERPGEGAVVLESAYARVGTIAGPALTDGYHFGQTWWNDFGRPLARGTSAIAGFSIRASKGRFFLYDRQELQQDPGAAALTSGQLQFIQSIDWFDRPGSPTFIQPVPVAAYTRQRPLELYAGMAFGGTALSFGKQEIYWGPTVIGPIAFSSNAEPTYNLRLMSTQPHPFPFLPSLGSYRFDVVFGKLSGHKYPARPYFNGQKIELTLGSDFEVSFTRWSILWGEGHPMTLHTLKDNIFSANSTGPGGYGDRTDPGDRKSDFDFRLHVPYTANMVTIYADAYADDELNPIDAPRRVIWSPGVYLSRLPYLPKADLRIEAVSSEELSQDECCTRFFFNNQYRDDNLNKGFLLGTAVGRDARAIEARAGYWFTPRTRFEAGYRQDKISENFLTHGGTISDGFINATYNISPEWTAHIFAQYERFFIPQYLTGSHHNESGWFDVTWTPKLHILKQK